MDDTIIFVKNYKDIDSISWWWYSVYKRYIHYTHFIIEERSIIQEIIWW